jgi:DDE family transposase
MITCKSPRKVMMLAWQLGKKVLPDHTSKFSRKDFTLPQLFACLVLREHQKKSFRGLEALLRDSQQWCSDIGLKRVPDHNTLCRAFAAIVTIRQTNKMLDLLAKCFQAARSLQLSSKPLAIDTTFFESHHRSRHYEKRREQSRAKTSGKAGQSRRSETVKRLPKMGVAVAAACHAILSVKTRTGGGGDSSWFEPLLFDAWRRAPVKKTVADAGLDAESNHRIARNDMGIQSFIPPTSGRPSKGPPGGKWRRRMARLLRTRRSRRRCGYTQRWQVETVNSMIKRNLGSALRARSNRRRQMEMILRGITHNLMLLRRQNRVGTEQECPPSAR